MKLKFYSALISSLLFISFASFADTSANSMENEKASKNRKEAVSGKKAAEYFSFKSSVYNKDGLVKKKRSKKGCPSFN